MTDSESATTIIFSSPQTQYDSTRIKQPFWIALGRIGWLSVLAITLYLFGSNLTYWLSISQTVCDSATCPAFSLTTRLANEMTALGLPLWVWGAHIAFLDTLAVALFVGTAFVIFLRRSNDWLALLATGMLATVSINVALSNTLSPFEGTPLAWLPQAHSTLAIYLALKFLMVFPNGRYVPRWGYLWIYAGVGWEIYRRLSAVAIVSAETNFRVEIFLVTFLFLGGAMLAQLYRYRVVSTPNQRQQTKWAVLGGALTVIGISVSASAYFLILPNLPPSVNSLPFNIALRLLYFAALYVLPISLGFSIVRYRIWDADLAINRSVVFVAVTAVLVVFFGVSLFAFRAVFLWVFGSELDVLATILATLLVAVLFQPTRLWVRHQIDRHIFGLRKDLNVLRQQVKARQRVQAHNNGALSDTYIGQYHLQEVIGRGGMGEVYRALDTRTRHPCAVKILSNLFSDDALALARFTREAKLARDLVHPNVVAVSDFGMQDNKVYLVMPYVDGRDLMSILRERRRLPLSEVQHIVKSVAGALEYIHACGMVHRDIKPSNVMQRENGDVLLMDFGIAKQVGTADALTTTGMVGTLDYAAPEQLMSAKTVDHRADIYALGVMTYQLLVGAPPFSGTVGQIVFAHLNQPPPDPRLALPDLPDRAALGILTALAKDPKVRLASANDLAAALN